MSSRHRLTEEEERKILSFVQELNDDGCIYVYSFHFGIFTWYYTSTI